MGTQHQQQLCDLEIWGGIESTINRINNNYFDQLNYAGHYTRGKEDIAALATTGIKMLRYPVLWERHQPTKDAVIDWSWITEQLNCIHEHGIIPIATLCHHGSGPSFTNLLDEKFPEHFVEYATKVAEQFPHLEYYTPINEPLTTARFSGLYGIWYPHKRNEHDFGLMLMNEMKAIILAMKAIRKINPNAKLIQTEDLGKTYCTQNLQYQADYENLRRWLSYDMLCGKFNRKHPLWKRFALCGISEETMSFFEYNFCPPDVMGFNYYVTSERYLDENYHHYPQWAQGSNGKDMYADVEAVRVNFDEPHGFRVLIREAWERYRLPLAMTEVHLHSWREEQLRWFSYIHNECLQAKKEGINLIAVTAWSMLGAFGWNNLLREMPGTYEPGVFDVRSGKARPTALATYLQNVSCGCSLKDKFVEHRKGWWESPNRFTFKGNNTFKIVYRCSDEESSPVLILGKTGTLGRAFQRICNERNIESRLLSRQDCDITDPQSIKQAIEKYKPWAIINTAGFVKVDEAEDDCDNCYEANTIGPKNLAQACAASGIKLITFSTDLVFDGKKKAPYKESDVVNPLNVYGKSKAEAEKHVLAADPSALIIRTAAFFSEHDEYNFVHHVINTLSNGERLFVAKDVHISPTYVPDLVNATLDLLIDNESGIWHLTNNGTTTWADLAYMAAVRAKLDTKLIVPCKNCDLNLPAPRPNYCVLQSEKGYALPGLENALDRFFEGYSKKIKLQQQQRVLSS